MWRTEKEENGYCWNTFSNILLETLKCFCKYHVAQYCVNFNSKYSIENICKNLIENIEKIFLQIPLVESISTAAAIQYISPLCASATDKYGDKYVDSTASITRPFILYSSFDFNETNTTIDFCDVCKIWIIPQISMLPILFLYWLQKNYISFSILIKQCFMFVFF